MVAVETTEVLGIISHLCDMKLNQVYVHQQSVLLAGSSQVAAYPSEWEHLWKTGRGRAVCLAWLSAVDSPGGGEMTNLRWS